jgi:hypothetical protein
LSPKKRWNHDEHEDTKAFFWRAKRALAFLRVFRGSSVALARTVRAAVYP